jgi:hypothetical protein
MPSGAMRSAARTASSATSEPAIGSVRYDSGDCPDAAHAGGFKSIGELLVWLNADFFT